MRVWLDKLIWLNTVALFSSFYVFDTNIYSRFILLGITILIACLILLKNNLHFPLYWHSFHTLVFLFALYCLLSTAWSIDPIASMIQGSTILQLLICMSVLYSYYVGLTTTTPLWNVIKWSGYIVTIYAFFYYGWSTLSSVLSVSGRLDNTFSNVNNLGMLAALSVVITLYQVLFEKFKFTDLLTLLNILLIAATGSRKAFMLLAGGCGLVLLLRYSSKNWFLSLVRYVILLGIMLLFLRIFLELPLLSGIKERFDTLFNMWRNTGEIDSSAFLRNWMIKIGWEQFLQHPILGAGMSSSGIILERILRHTYFHNNYIELLACGGLVGFGLYYAFFIISGLQLFTQRHLPDKNTLLCLVVLFMLLIMDIGAVSSGAKPTYFYLMIFFIQIRINKHYLAQKKRSI